MKRTVLFYLADGRAEWNFVDIITTIRAPWGGCQLKMSTFGIHRLGWLMVRT